MNQKSPSFITSSISCCSCRMGDTSSQTAATAMFFGSLPSGRTLLPIFTAANIARNACTPVLILFTTGFGTHLASFTSRHSFVREPE